jgi:hypothetical protein
MGGRPDDRTDDEGGRWLPLADAAAALGLRSGEALRGRIRRNRTRYRTRRTDRGDLLVWAASADDHPADRTDVRPAQPDETPDARDVELAALRATVEGLHGRLESVHALVEAQRQHIADMRGELAAERQRVDRLLERLAEPPARRQWRWWRRGG